MPRQTALYTGGATMALLAIPSGVALLATESNCNSNPDGDTTNPEWTFSGYCKALGFHTYDPPAVFAGGILEGVFALPLLAVLIATLLGAGRRRLGPVKWGFYVGMVTVAVLFGLDILFAHATFRGAG